MVKIYITFMKAYTPWEWHEEIFECAKEFYAFLRLLTKQQ